MSKNKIYIEEAQVPMYDLGCENEKLSGIFSIGYTEQDIKNYMSDYYSDETNVENQSYDLVESYMTVFNNAFQLLGINWGEEDVNILELGAGFGSGTYAMASILKNSRIIATELSTAMLMRHKNEGLTRFPECEKQILRCQINADELIFKNNSFDLVFGTALLHHVFDPLRIIKEAGRLLRPNGIAIFCEPFEPGYALLKIAYEFFLFMVNNKRFPFNHTSLTLQQRNYLTSCINVWNANRVDMPHSKDDINNRDDKWIFSYEYFDESARNAGFDKIIKIPIAPPENNHIEQLYNIHTTGNNITLPPKCLEIVKIIDNAFSKPQLRSLPHDGVLILQKVAK